MRTIAISSGHGSKVPGAQAPYMDEVTQARRVVAAVAEELTALGVPFAGPFNDDVSTDQNSNLNRIVNWHNAQRRDLDVSVHFNANSVTSSPMGTECLYVTQEQLAAEVADAVSAAGSLKDRGPKYRSDLFFLNNTTKPAILIEVCFQDSRADCDTYNLHFAQISRSIAQTISDVTQRPPIEPIEPPSPPEEGERPMLKEGDDGPYVVELQNLIEVVEPDGDFGNITDTWVKAFQGAAKLYVDGKVGDDTWEAADALQARVAQSDELLPKEMAKRIYTAAQTSEIADYSWEDRGVAPQGYIPGMALSFAYASLALRDGKMAALAMSVAEGDPNYDALAWYHEQFAKLGMRNNVPGQDTLRHLFDLMIGLGPRESSGKYFEGRDLSASNIEADTCEAGLFQTSWNIRNFHSTIPPLLPAFWEQPSGFRDVFAEGLRATADNLNSYGAGDGVRYQFLSRYCPLFHIAVTGVGMRYGRKHWGPINERKAELRPETETLLLEVEGIALG